VREDFGLAGLTDLARGTLATCECGALQFTQASFDPFPLGAANV